ncbi:MAG TPA: flavin reductase family protein [Dongiaceae bacterium]|jgi:flavin reductase (DIM6/NTAB) family NADH-FMN oxidoreductase RutF|nr:flavin reductase family protein [Dongiaceae bacterium]
MEFDSQQLRRALGYFATGVTIVTTRTEDGALLGFTANSFTSVSLDPPLVLFTISREGSALRFFERSGCFAINVLHAHQQSLSASFASGQIGERWRGLAPEAGETGAPLLPGSLARFDCLTHAIHEGGDHRIIVGRVLRFDTDPDLDPLIFFRGAYNEIKVRLG